MEPRTASKKGNSLHSENKIAYSDASDINVMLINESDPSHMSVNNKILPSCPSIGNNSKSEASSKIETDDVNKHLCKSFQKLTWNQDSYEGTIVASNLHGPGFYLAHNNGQKLFYDGQFYVNKLEGYCQVFYHNGTHFQGLFKEHLRYGPGILSYPLGMQDVGFWNGFRLIRLACVVGYNIVPTLARTQIGKTKILCNRYLIPLSDEDIDILKQVSKSNVANEADIPNADDIFNVNVRNPNSLFFHKKFYDDHFFGGQDCTIKVYLDDLDNEEPEEPSLVSNDSITERIRRLRGKIKEVNENLEIFLALKENILPRLNKCRKCCEPDEPAELSATSEQSMSTDPEDSTVEYVKLDASMESLIIPHDSDILDTIENQSLDSTIKNVVEHICICGEEDTSNDLQYLEEELQNVTIQETYYRNIRDELQKKLDRNIENNHKKYEVITYKLVKVKELLAWNNEDSLMQMQRHCFKHRNSEDMVNFSVPNLILGERKAFGPPGNHEKMCHTFLEACGKGKKEFVKECLRENKVHPNLADAKGNSGVFFAAAKNQQDIISVLINFGAKLDQLNDEQLTPLSMCFLKYIAVNNNCGNWETAFLLERKVCEVPDLPKWYDIKSFLSITSLSSRNSTDIGSHGSHCSNLRIIDLFHRMSTVEQKGASLARSLYNTAYIFDLNCKSPDEKRAVEAVNSNVENELNFIHLTIMTLLDYGANPNVCEIPYPPLVLSLFTENPELVKEVIKANADINVLIEENLSCLHIAASLNPSLKNVNICLLLAKYGCNPNLKSLPSHWVDRRSYFTGDLPEKFEIEDFGKNALHLLCMRYDFEWDQSNYFCSIAKILLDTNINIDDTYLGHSCLSLAVISGNIKLVQCLLKTNLFNPYQVLDYGMGNILTLYSLKRFHNVLPIEHCKAMLTALCGLEVNVLYKVNDAENAIVFAEEKDHYFDQFIENDAKKETKGKAKPNLKKLDKHSQGFVLIEFMKTLGRQMIIKQIQIVVTEILYESIEEGILEDNEIFVILANEYLTPQIAVQNLEHLFLSKKLEHDRLDYVNIKTLLEFTNVNKKIIKKAVSKTPKAESSKTGIKQAPEENMDQMVDTFVSALNLQKVPPKFLTVPGLDDPLRYKVCYHCLRGKDKDLKTCPRCQMIQFCSVQCNKLNLKLKTQHGCNILFYDMTDEQTTNISKGLCLNEVVQVTREKCADRWQKTREHKLWKEEEKLIEMWRADTYGTKFLQIKPFLDKAILKRKDKQLNWNIGLLRGILERNFQKHPGEAIFYSLENLLLRLSKPISEGTLRTKHSYSTKRSTLGGSTVQSMIFFDLCNVQPDDTSPSCRCPKSSHHVKSKAKEKSNVKTKQEADQKYNHQLINYISDERSDELKNLIGTKPVHEKALPIIKKLNKIPARYQRFIETVGTYFPDIDFSSWLLPYACCSDGQLYYKFCTDDLFKESYSFS